MLRPTLLRSRGRLTTPAGRLTTPAGRNVDGAAQPASSRRAPLSTSGQRLGLFSSSQGWSGATRLHEPVHCAVRPACANGHGWAQACIRWMSSGSGGDGSSDGKGGSKGDDDAEDKDEDAASTEVDKGASTSGEDSAAAEDVSVDEEELAEVDAGTNTDEAIESDGVGSELVTEPWRTATGITGPISIPDEYPEVLVIPLDTNPLFPKFFKVLTISDRKLINRLQILVKTNQPFCGAFLRREPSDNKLDTVDDASELYEMGTFCHVTQLEDQGNGEWKLLIQGVRRINITGTLEGDGLMVVKVENAVELEHDKNSKRLKAYKNEILTTLRDLMKFEPLYRESVREMMKDGANEDFHNPAILADITTGLINADDANLQEVLEELDVERRLQIALELLKEEYVQLKLQADIGKQVEEKINKARRTHMLHEQLNVIKRELGITKDDKDTVVDKFKARLEDLEVPNEVEEVISEEMNKIAHLDPNSSEFSVTRNYLDWLTAIPWGKTTTDNLDIQHALAVLDDDHYGMKDAKDRVLEFIAVGKLKGDVQGKIMCFNGPPGVGKTSIGKSIAKALNREFFRFSVGGLHDVAEIKGHRRTYVGAMPGKPIQCLKRTQSENPLILIDEIDKLGAGGRNGDPASALLELLDPEQNKNFLDHYLDVPVDLSKVLFLCTSNTTDTIPGPLLDRMEVIQLSGYMADEKVSIAEKYLLPVEAENAGVGEGVSVSNDAVSTLIRSYCRESGVRNLQKQIEKVYRKAALKMVRDGEERVEVNTENLHEFVGQPVFTSDRLFEVTPPGVVMGLAWTSMGGSALYIETIANPPVLASDGDASPSPGFSVTGNLGDVMKESSTIAYTFAKRFLHEQDPENEFFGTANINMHVPEGATPKDGPSAGVTIVTAVLSLALGRPVRADLAMTGEVSLTGKVLRVGGIKEKTLAAKRAGVTCIVIPDSCRTDFNELPEQVKEGLEVHFAKDYKDVFRIALDY